MKGGTLTSIVKKLFFSPLCLPEAWDDNPNKYEGKSGVVTGWGPANIIETDPSHNLEQLDVTIFDLG